MGHNPRIEGRVGSHGMKVCSNPTHKTLDSPTTLFTLFGHPSSNCQLAQKNGVVTVTTKGPTTRAVLLGHTDS